MAVGKLGKAEVDFVAMGDDGPRYLQVAQSILDEKTRERELAPLEKIADNYPKTVLSLDRIGTGDIGSLIATGRHARCVRTL